MKLNDKNIILGITASIAAYKTCELVRMFQKEGANVKVIMTESAKEFVSPLVLSTLSKNKVYIEQFDYTSFDVEHISLAEWGDIIVVAPLSANTLSKIANGICDNLLTSVICAFTKKVIIAPAMNENMWNNKIIQENYNKLLNSGYISVGPVEGYLACGTTGAGKMAALNDILEAVKEAV